jgi:hypothetical protein
MIVMVITYGRNGNDVRMAENPTSTDTKDSVNDRLAALEARLGKTFENHSAKSAKVRNSARRDGRGMFIVSLFSVGQRSSLKVAAIFKR